MGGTHFAFEVGAHPRIAQSFIWLLSVQSLATIRLAVVSGVRVVREGLVSALQARRYLGVDVVGCVGPSEAEVGKLSELWREVILVDLTRLVTFSPAGKCRGTLRGVESVLLAREKPEEMT